MLTLKILTLLLLLINHSNGQLLEFSKIDSNIDLALTHIKEIQVNYKKHIHGFHHYKPNSIEKYKDSQDIKICKINNDLWVVTNGNPWSFHTGYILYITPKKHILDYKNFFPSAWSTYTLTNKLSNVLTLIKNKTYEKLQRKKVKHGYLWIIDITLKQNIKLIITYDTSRDKYIVINMFPDTKQSEDINIDTSILVEIMDLQKSNKESLENAENLII